MKKANLYILFLIICCLSCTHTPPDGKRTTEIPLLFPDYSEVTIPYNIAPLNFSLTSPHQEAYACLNAGKKQIQIKAKKGEFRIPSSQWKALTQEATGKTIEVTLYANNQGWIIYPTFRIYVANEPIDSHLAYRLIEPGYELWNQMGIYQRNLENYTENPIIENTTTEHNCMNCHSFCMQNPGKMVFHMREKFAGSYLVEDNQIRKLSASTKQHLSAPVYPSWHPSGKYIAFSVNKTAQSFHQNDRNRVEVFDSASDVIVYDVEKDEILTCGLLSGKESFETFPTFSPDGKTLYFCSAKALSMPASFDKVAYSLCSISFDPINQSFGSEVDTLYNANEERKSVSFPRVSPNGKFLMYTLSDYGNFSIWHKDADLYMVNLSSGNHYPLKAINSDDVESYHSWSSNSKWVVFSSRRIDGLYTRPYFTYITEEGEATKPFLMPQKSTGFYHQFMKSYNIPEFITGKVKASAHQITVVAKEEK